MELEERQLCGSTAGRWGRAWVLSGRRGKVSKEAERPGTKAGGWEGWRGVGGQGASAPGLEQMVLIAKY